MGQSSYVATWTELICTWMRGRRARGIETVVISGVWSSGMEVCLRALACWDSLSRLHGHHHLRDPLVGVHGKGVRCIVGSQ